MRFLVSIWALDVILALGWTVGSSAAQVPPASAFEARVVELAPANTSGFEGKPLSGLILEIESVQPALELVMDGTSIRIKGKDGAAQSPILMFPVGIAKGKVEPSSIEGTVLQGKEVSIGDVRYKAYTSMATMAVNMEEGGGMKYTFVEPSVFRIAFVFPVDEAAIVGLELLGQSIDLSRTELDLSGDWGGNTTWPEMTASVGFSVDNASMFLSGVRVVLECKAGEPKTKVQLTADQRVRIAKDGSFQLTFPQAAATLSGRFGSPERASGDLKGTLSAQCGPKMVKAAGQWSSEKVTKE